MATCHAITWIKKGSEQYLIGDPLDVKMFECTEWILDEENTTNTIAQRMHPKNAEKEYRINLLRRFDFTS